MENHEEGKKKQKKKNRPTTTYNGPLFNKLCIDETTI